MNQTKAWGHCRGIWRAFHADFKNTSFLLNFFVGGVNNHSQECDYTNGPTETRDSNVFSLSMHHNMKIHQRKGIVFTVRFYSEIIEIHLTACIVIANLVITFS